MKHPTYLSCTLVIIFFAFTSYSQNLKKGDTVQVKVNGEWKDAVVKGLDNSGAAFSKQVSVTLITPTTLQRGVYIRPVNKDNVHPKAGPALTVAQKQLPKEILSTALAGKYAIYSGIQKTYIGHFILMNNGTYKVALSSAEDRYGNGFFDYQNEQHAILWNSGLFFNNNWKGKITMTEGGVPRIQFNSQTYADKIEPADISL